MTACLGFFYLYIRTSSLPNFSSSFLCPILKDMAESIESLKPGDIILNSSKTKGWRKSVYIAATLAAVGGVRILLAGSIG